MANNCKYNPLHVDHCNAADHLQMSVVVMAGDHGDKPRKIPESCVHLTHLPLTKMAAISQMIFSNAFLWMKILYFDWYITEVCS